QKQALEQIANKRADAGSVHPGADGREEADVNEEPQKKGENPNGDQRADGDSNERLPRGLAGRRGAAPWVEAYAAAATLRPLAKAEHSAMTREARAIGFVR